MDGWQWVSIASAALLLLAAGISWWKRRPRRAFTIDHIRVELHPARVVDDRVVETVWRAAISMTNRSRRPRVLPLLAERATVRTARRQYLAKVYLDADVREINPSDTALAWAEVALPAGRTPGNVKLTSADAEGEWKRVRLSVPSAIAPERDEAPASRVAIDPTARS